VAQSRFSDLELGSELTLLNTAAAPFDGSAYPAADAPTPPTSTACCHTRR
jgi:hypothetical protein